MSYYPTERRGGCMESISRCCRQAYVYPVDTRKLLYAAGAVIGVVLVAVVWSGLSSSEEVPQPKPLKGSTVLHLTPLIVGSNFFSTNLKELANNNVSSVPFGDNLKNNSLFGNEHCKSCQTDIPRLKSGLVGSQVWSIDVPCNAMYKDAVSLTLEQVDAVTRLVSSYPDRLTLISSVNDVKEAFSSQDVGSILAVTSGHSVDGRMAVLRTLHKLGVRIMALTSNCSTSWAASYTAIGKNDTGLSEFGKALVKEMNRLGILIDLSESSYHTQLDVLKTSKAPVIFSRAAAYSLVKDDRNIKDDILEQLKINQGVVMVTFAQKYLGTNASIDTVIDHINYFKNITGITGVGIGAEFDAVGLTYPSELSDVSSFPTLFDKLGNTLTNIDDLKKLAGDNLLRVLEAVEKYAKESRLLPADETYQLQNESSCYSDYDSRKLKPVVKVLVATSAPQPAAPITKAPETTKKPAELTKEPAELIKEPATQKPAEVMTPVPKHQNDTTTKP